MSHAVRNSIILFFVLLLFAASSWGYIRYYQVREKENLEQVVEKKNQELKANQEIANRYPALRDTYEEASVYFNNYEKTLYRSSNEDNVYDFLNSMNSGLSFTNFNFAFIDSTIFANYGIINMEISGEGSYRNLVNFIRGVERSKPLNKVKEVSITPIQTEDDNYNTVSFTFNLESYYDRSKILEKPSYDIYNGSYASVYNPFLPLVRDIEPNKDNKIDISQSTLVALSTRQVFLVDQNGHMQRLRIGDKVYLGRLSSINLDNRTAIFTLNKGGIVAKDTLEVKNEN